MKWSPRDFLAMILAMAVALGLVLVAVQPFFTGQPISDERSKTVGIVVGAIVAMLAQYLSSSRIGRKDDEDETRDEDK